MHSVTTFLAENTMAMVGAAGLVVYLGASLTILYLLLDAVLPKFPWLSETEQYRRDYEKARAEMAPEAETCGAAKLAEGMAARATEETAALERIEANVNWMLTST